MLVIGWLPQQCCNCASTFLIFCKFWYRHRVYTRWKSAFITLKRFASMCKLDNTCCNLDCLLLMKHLANHCCTVCSLHNWSSNSSTLATAWSTVRSLSICLPWYGLSSLQCTRTGKILPSRSLTRNLLEPRDNVILVGPIDKYAYSIPHLYATLVP